MSSRQESAMSPTMVASQTLIANHEHDQSTKQHGRSAVLDAMPSYVKELIAGGTAGGFAKTAVAPLERIKILFQTKQGSFHSLGVSKSLGQIMRDEGVRGLYKGNGASVLRIVPYAAIHFMAYEQYRCYILNNFPALGSGPFIDLLAGSVAGGTAVALTYPLDLARTKLAYEVSGLSKTGPSKILRSGCAQPQYTGVIDVFRKVYSERGFRGLYRGVGPTMFGILPYAGLKFFFYEELKSHVPPEQRSSIAVKLACGASAGLLGQTFTYPIDVVKRQMQVQSNSLGSLSASTNTQAIEHRIKGTMHGLAMICRTQGWKQLFAGLSINYIKIVPSVAIGFATYDGMKSWLGCPPREKSQIKTSI